MATKKVKGQKIDLATFNGNEAESMSLPSAPNPFREPNEGGRRRRDFDNDRGQRNDQRSFKENDGGFEGNWSRNDATSTRNSNSFTNNSSAQFEGRRDDGDGRFNEPWQRSSTQSSQQNNSRFDNSGRSDQQFKRDAPMQRPDHLRLKMEPRNLNTSMSGPSSSSSLSADPDDKWSKVFSKTKQSYTKQQQQPSNSNQDVRNTFDGLKLDDQNQNSNASGNMAATKDKRTLISKVPSDSKLSEKEILLKQQQEQALKTKNLDAEKRKQEKEVALLKVKVAAEEKSLIEAKMSELAEELINTNLKGDEIKNYTNEMSVKPTSASVVRAVLKRQTTANILWLNDTEYGVVIKNLIRDTDDKVNVLFAVQEFCHGLKFPKIDVKGTQRNLIEVIFQLLFKKEIIDDSSFLAWAEDDRDFLGRVNAIVQTTNFIQLLTADDDEDDDEFEEEEDVDRPREIVK